MYNRQMIYRLTPLQPKKIQIVRKNVERIVSCLFFKVLFMSYDFFLNSVYTSIGIIALQWGLQNIVVGILFL